MQLNRYLSALGMVLALASTSASADNYVWLTRDGTTAQAHYGELIPAAPSTPAMTLMAAHAYLSQDKQDLPLHANAQGYAITTTNTAGGKDLRFTAAAVENDGTLHVYEAREGRSQTKPGNDLELVPTTANGTTFRLYWQGNPVAAAQVNVQTSAGWSRTLTPNADGTVSLVSPPFPQLFASLYVLQVEARLNGPTTLDGKTYPHVLHTATLSFEVPK